MKTDPELLEKLIAKLRSDIDLPNARLSNGYYYASLPLAVTDSVFSIGARYETVVNAVHHLANLAGWQVYRPHGTPYLEPGKQHTISDLLAEFRKVYDPTEVFGNLQYANPPAKHPIRKAHLVKLVAEKLAAKGIETFNDFEAYPEPHALEEQLRSLPSLSSGVVASYLGMLCGNDQKIKPDRHIHAFIRAASGDSTLKLSNSEAVCLIQKAARHLMGAEELRHITPRLLDHAVWRFQRKVGAKKRPRIREKSAPLKAAQCSQGPVAADHPGDCAIGLQGALQMNQFWPFCVHGGTTPFGLTFRVDEQERLHIISIGSKNQNYKIRKRTVEAYLEKLHDVRFRRDHGWFCNVAEFARHQLR